MVVVGKSSETEEAAADVGPITSDAAFTTTTITTTAVAGVSHGTGVRMRAAVYERQVNPLGTVITLPVEQQHTSSEHANQMAALLTDERRQFHQQPQLYHEVIPVPYQTHRNIKYQQEKQQQPSSKRSCTVGIGVSPEDIVGENPKSIIVKNERKLSTSCAEVQTLPIDVNLKEEACKSIQTSIIASGGDTISAIKSEQKVKSKNKKKTPPKVVEEKVTSDVFLASGVSDIEGATIVEPVKERKSSSGKHATKSKKPLKLQHDAKEDSKVVSKDVQDVSDVEEAAGSCSSAETEQHLDKSSPLSFSTVEQKTDSNSEDLSSATFESLVDISGVSENIEKEKLFENIESPSTKLLEMDPSLGDDVLLRRGFVDNLSGDSVVESAATSSCSEEKVSSDLISMEERQNDREKMPTKVDLFCDLSESNTEVIVDDNIMKTDDLDEKPTDIVDKDEEDGNHTGNEEPANTDSSDENKSRKEAKPSNESKKVSTSPSRALENKDDTESSDEQISNKTVETPRLNSLKQIKRKKGNKKVNEQTVIDNNVVLSPMSFENQSKTIDGAESLLDILEKSDYETCSEKKSDSSVESFPEFKRKSYNNTSIGENNQFVESKSSWSSIVKRNKEKDSEPLRPTNSAEDRDSVYESCNDEDFPILETNVNIECDSTSLTTNSSSCVHTVVIESNVQQKEVEYEEAKMDVTNKMESGSSNTEEKTDSGEKDMFTSIKNLKKVKKQKKRKR